MLRHKGGAQADGDAASPRFAPGTGPAAHWAVLAALPALLCAFGVTGDLQRPSAFVPPPGAAVVHARAQAQRAGVSYDDDGVRVDDEGLLLRLGGLVDSDVGIGRGLALGLSLPLVIAHVRDGADGGSVVGAGDARAALALVVVDGGAFAVAVRGDVKVPLYPSLGVAVRGRVPGPNRSARPLPALGDGQVDVGVGAVFSAEFGSRTFGDGVPFGGSFDFSLGGVFRSGAVSDAVVGAGGVAVDVWGGRFSPGWQLQFVNAFDGDAGDAVGAGFVSTGPAVAVPLSSWVPGLTVDMGAELVFRARNAAGGTVLRAGVIYVF